MLFNNNYLIWKVIELLIVHSLEVLLSCSAVSMSTVLFFNSELREKVLPDIKSLVRQQRLAQLVEGQLFHRVLSRGKQKG